MTLQDLKNNREIIINFINERGYNLKFAMDIAVESCGQCKDLEELFAEIQHFCKPVKSTRNAEILGKLAEMEIN